MKEEKKSINLIEGDGVISVSVDNCINSYYAKNLSKRRRLRVKRFEST